MRDIIGIAAAPCCASRMAQVATRGSIGTGRPPACIRHAF